MDAPADDDSWLVDLEIALVKAFGWSLRDIDETNIESLIPFINRLIGPGDQTQAESKKVFCDQVDFFA